MKTKHLHIKAGEKAYARLMEKGLQPKDIKVFAAAAGGPKWIILYHLDLYMMQNFLKEHEQPIHFIGASIGAWRSMTYSHNDPVEAMHRLSYEYIHQRYSEDASWNEVTEGCRKLITNTLGNGTQHILSNTQRKLHIQVSQDLNTFKTNTNRNLKYKFGKMFLQHWLYRKSIGKHLKRLTFSNAEQTLILDDGIASELVLLTEENLLPALRASGAIPLIMEPISIDGHDCWDGGIVDYHLDFKYDIGDKLVLYPHFFGYIKPGWFDKKNPFRFSKHHHNTVLIYPSPEFVQMLPNQKLTDLKDFYAYAKEPDERIKVWLKAREMGKYLVEDFEKLLNPETLRENLQQF